MSKHRATPQSWLPLAFVGAVLLVGIAFLIVGFVSIRFGDEPPVPARTVVVPGPTITQSYLVIVTGPPTTPPIWEPTP